MSAAFPDLLDDWLEGDLTDEGAAMLAALLRADPVCRDQARNAWRLRRLLPLALSDATADAFTRGVLHDLGSPTGRFAIRTMATIRPNRSRRLRPISRRIRRHGSRPTRSWVGLGASLAAAGILTVVALLLAQPGRSTPAILAHVEVGTIEHVDDTGVWRSMPSRAVVTDGTQMRVSAPGRLRTVAGSTIQLAAGSEINLTAGDAAPRVTLVSGACFVTTVSADHGLTVHTRHGAAQAIGTRFGVAIAGGETIVGVIAGAVEARTARASLRVAAGHCARITATVSAIADDPAIRFAWATGTGVNQADAQVNLALLPEARLSGSIPEGTGRGSLREILFDPATDAYVAITDHNEYGTDYEAELGVVREEDPFHWTVEWPQAQNINAITVGGSYANQPQPMTGWAIRYRSDGRWHDLDRGRGGWIDGGIFTWGGPGQQPIIADAVRVALFSIDGEPLHSVHLRGRGGVSVKGDTLANNSDDRAAPTKATLIQFLPSR